MQQSPTQLYPISLSFKVLISVLLLGSLLLHSAHLFAETGYRQIELRYRNAFSMQQRLAPFTDNDVVIIAEGNSLILKGPTAGLNQLVGIIKMLDKPRQQFQVSIYRGSDPSVININDKVQDQRWSTQTNQQNRVDVVNIEEGSILIINESELVTVPVEEALAIGKALEPESLSVQKQDNDAFKSTYQRADNLLVEKGVKLVATLVKDDKGKSSVSLTSTYSLPAEKVSDSMANRSRSSSRDLNRETTLTTRVDLGQWQLLSSHQTQSHRPAINSTINSTMSSRIQVSSTQKKGESEYKVWVKFSLL